MVMMTVSIGTAVQGLVENQNRWLRQEASATAASSAGPQHFDLDPPQDWHMAPNTSSGTQGGGGAQSSSGD
eukprot:5247574-Pyramimonas_sp.AAC.1